MGGKPKIDAGRLLATLEALDAIADKEGVLQGRLNALTADPHFQDR